MAKGGRAVVKYIKLVNGRKEDGEKKGGQVILYSEQNCINL